MRISIMWSSRCYTRATDTPTPSSLSIGPLSQPTKGHSTRMWCAIGRGAGGWPHRCASRCRPVRVSSSADPMRGGRPPRIQKCGPSSGRCRQGQHRGIQHYCDVRASQRAKGKRSSSSLLWATRSVTALTQRPRHTSRTYRPAHIHCTDRSLVMTAYLYLFLGLTHPWKASANDLFASAAKLPPVNLVQSSPGPSPSRR